MGLKPTQYRCAAESLLRRFRKEGSLPRLHPLVDLCNAVSLAFAVPVAVLDADQVAWPLEVRYASGDEDYLTFGGEVEHPAPGEVIFADQAGQAHARRWTNRQSGRSAVSPATSTVLIVAEALHERRGRDHPRAHQDPDRRDRQDLDRATTPDRHPHPRRPPLHPGVEPDHENPQAVSQRQRPALRQPRVLGLLVRPGLPGPPRYRSATTEPRWYASIAAAAGPTPTGNRAAPALV